MRLLTDEQMHRHDIIQKPNSDKNRNNWMKEYARLHEVKNRYEKIMKLTNK